MKSEAAFTKKFRLSERLSVEMTTGPAGFTCEWSPAPPHYVTRGERRAYLRARKEMLRRLAEILGGQVAVFDLDADGSLKPATIAKERDR